LLPRRAILAGVVINTTSFFASYGAALIAAGVILLITGHGSPVTLVPSVVFILVCVLITAMMLEFAGKSFHRGRRRFLRFRLVRSALNTAGGADPRLVRNTRLQLLASGYQLLTFVLDGATLWVLLRSIGEPAPPGYVFASFMVANLVRTLSLIPWGFGTLEAATVLMLRQGGVPVAAALSAALLFRGFTFFLPMFPGLWFSHGLTRRQTH
jgi:Mg2+-importing ATPase